MTLDHGGVGDCICRDPLLFHGCKESGNILSTTAACLGVNQGVVDNSIQCGTLAACVAPELHGLLGAAVGGKALHDCGQHHHVGPYFGLPLAVEIDSLGDLLVADKGIHHAAQDNVIRLQQTILGQLPPERPTEVEALQEARSLDQGSIQVHGRLHRGSLIKVQEILQTFALTELGANFQQCVEEHLFGANVDIAAVQESQDA
mmetsp:Transcript_47674/g.102089  ORF Transcript_47674/g.102089 Transcript_47674/m.102089 type:complete len:203 (+) Transcript_47674:859-1467(+)